MSAQVVSDAAEAAVRAEIDTSAPFESVKEAANRFGGFGFWRPISFQKLSEHDSEVVEISKLEEEAAQLEKDLIVKERETLDVLKELESTKLIVEELKLMVQKEASDVNAARVGHSGDVVHLNTELPEKENHENMASYQEETVIGPELSPPAAPGFILSELKQAKLNLARTTNDIADIRATVESYTQKIEKERISLEKTRQRLSSNASKISSLEEELNQTRKKLHVVNDAEAQVSCDDSMPMTEELQRLSSETEQFKKTGEAARSEILKAISEIEQTKTRLKTAEMRLIAAKKLKEAASASEAVALAEIKALSNSEDASGASQQNPDGITLNIEEYTSLIHKAREAEEASKMKVVDAMLQGDEVSVSKTEILKKVEEATEEVKTSKKALEEALSRVEAANRGKLAVEEALRRWRSERGQKRHTVHNVTKFKNVGTSHHRKDSALLDVNGMNPVNDELKPTLSIGQILRRKLFLTKVYENGTQAGQHTEERKVSLGQMLGKTNGVLHSASKGKNENNPKQLPAKRKKFGLARLSFLVMKQSKKKKKQTASSKCRSV